MEAHANMTVIVVKLTKVFGVVVTEKTLGLVLCCSLLSSLSLCSLSYSSRISAGVRFLSTTYVAISKGSEETVETVCTMWQQQHSTLRQKAYVRQNKYLPAFHLQPFLPKDVIDGSGVLITQH